MNPYPHLHEKTVKKLELSVDQRILEVGKARWIGYSKAAEILERFEVLLNHARVSRMPNLMLLGRTNNGKTDLLKQFCKKHTPDEDSDMSHMVAPVLYLQAPPSPNESDLYSALLSSLYQRVPTASVASKRARVIKVLSEIELKVLCIDELHNSLAGSTTKRQQFLNSIKYLGNELQISIIASGTEDLRRAVAIDGQIQNRFEEVILPKWQCNYEFKQLLRTFEAILPLAEPSNLSGKQLSRKLYALSEGAIGELSNLLERSAIFALQNHMECITEDVIERCGFVAPSARSSGLSGVI